MPFKGEKLRVNLRLCINRLKLLEKKKTEQAMKARKEIADYIKAGRIERARIRVEHIIREDYLVEAMEVIELYCDLLLARFGMLEQMKYCEESIMEPVSTLIWVAPRLTADIQELTVVDAQLEKKFGKEFALQARSNLAGTVNPKVIHRLSVDAPKKSLVENYLIEIARNYKVDYEPDPSALMDEDDLPGPPPDEKPFFPGGGEGGETDTRYQPLPQQVPEPMPHPPSQGLPYPGGPQQQQHPAFPPNTGGAMPLPQKLPPSQFQAAGRAPPYTEQPPPPHNPALPYPSGQPQQMPQPGGGLDLPPVPTTGFPDSTAGSEGGGDVDFDDLTRRFEELKKRK